MRSRIVVGCLALLMFFTFIWAIVPARAVTDGPTRRTLETLHYSEHMIKESLYKRNETDAFQFEKRKFVHGIPRTNLPVVLEPDVYTWDLAMAAHRRQMTDVPSTLVNPPGAISPVPMTPGAFLPGSPDQVYLTPLGQEAYISTQLPPGADEKMMQMLYRARGAGLGVDSQLRGAQIRDQLVNHMNSLVPAYQPQPGGYGNQPSVPILPSNAPRGKAADSFDQEF